MLVILASIFIILLVLGMPIAFTMGIACLGTVVYSPNAPQYAYNQDVQCHGFIFR